MNVLMNQKPCGPRAATALLAAVLFLASCDSPLVPLPDGQPEEFEFSIGGWMSEVITVELRGDTLVYVRIPPVGEASIDSTRTIPTAEAWQTFWSAAGRAGFRKWRERYVADDILDGSGWSVRVRSSGLRFESEGSNAYPDRGGREYRSETWAFKHFVNAVDQLAGAN